jgi:chromosome segregation ATPase
MATATTQAHCYQCDEEKDIYDCKGCSKTFCFDHVTKHREGIDQEFIQIEHHCNSFRQTIIDQKNDPNKHPLIQEIEQWKQESIQKIEQIANQCQQRLIRYTNQFLIQTENQLNQLTEQLKQIRQKNKLNEFDLDQLKNKLTKLQKELDQPSNVTIQQQPTSFINKISVIISFPKGNRI